MKIIIGLLIIAIGAFCQSSSYVPINKIKQWSWESYWMVQGLFAWLLFPLLGALLAVPSGESLFAMYAAHPAESLKTIFFGILWGVGGLTFGLSMRYLGVALGQSIALGTCAGLGTILTPVFTGNTSDLTAPVIVGVVVTLIGIAIIGAAGARKAKEAGEGAKDAVKDFNFGKGILLCNRPWLRRESRVGSHQTHIQDTARHPAGNIRRIPHQCLLLLLPEQQEQDMERLLQGLSLG